MSTVRPPGAPGPKPPPPSAVARDLVTLDDLQWLDAECAFMQYLRAIPAIAAEVTRLEVQRPTAPFAPVASGRWRRAGS